MKTQLKTARAIADLLGIEGLRFDDWGGKGDAFAIHQVRRRARYYCGAMRRAADGESNAVNVPPALVAFFEAQPRFEGWGKFSRVWDLSRDMPTEIYYRDFSVEEEWDATLRRVVPELPVDRMMRRNNGPESHI